MNYSTSLGGGQGDSKGGRQNRFLVVSGSEPPDIAGIFPLLFYVIGDALGRLRRASVEVMLEVDVDPHVVRPIGCLAVVQEVNPVQLLVQISELVKLCRSISGYFPGVMPSNQSMPALHSFAFNSGGGRGRAFRTPDEN